MDFDGWGLCSPFGRHCCLPAGFQGLNGTLVMASVVPRSGGLLHLACLCKKKKGEKTEKKKKRNRKEIIHSLNDATHLGFRN